jgi:ribosomal protein S14
MKKIEPRDKKNRIFSLRRELNRKVIKSFIYNSDTNDLERLFLYKKLAKIDRLRFFKSMSKNVCIITGRSRGINYLGLSRIKIREYQAMGIIIGLKKVS